jgi:hypothetical protein
VLYYRRWHIQVAIEHEDITALAVKAANIHFPAWSPTGYDDMLLDGELWCQANQLQDSGSTIIEQDIGLAGASEIANVNVQCRPPAIGGRGRIVKADQLGNNRIFTSWSCKARSMSR